MMHQPRRRKKRPNVNIKTVEITRGKKGFGFTISGQAPCVLSCVLQGSPAEYAGLKTGDCLVAVNEKNVLKTPHDDVVRLIGNCNGLLKLQIAANCIESSDDELLTVIKCRPKYSHKVRHRHNQSSVSRAEKVVQDLQTGALFVDHIHGFADSSQKQHDRKLSTTGVVGSSRSNKALLDIIVQQHLKEGTYKKVDQLYAHSEDLNVVTAKQRFSAIKKKERKVIKSRSHPECLNSSKVTSDVFHTIFTEEDLNNILYPAIFAAQNQIEENKKSFECAILKAVVGYLGTIEMPKEPQVPNSRLQTIRNCIRRLRIEKKVHTLVLMTILPECIILVNPQGLTLAEFATEKITFSGVYSDDKKFFGLVTNNGTSSDQFNEGSHEDPISISSSCHVFMVDPKLTPHHQHAKRAKAFHINCTPDPATDKCKEFPESTDTILQAVVGLYKNRLGLNIEAVHGLEFHANMSPQPSHASSNSSNSDSGIGFRDEGNAIDQVYVLDVDNFQQYNTNSLDRQAFPTPNFGIHDTASHSFGLSQDSSLCNVKLIAQFQPHELKNSLNTKCSFDRLTVRAMPDPVGFEKNSDTANAETPRNQPESPDIRSNQNFKLSGCASLVTNSGHSQCNFRYCEDNQHVINDTSSSYQQNLCIDLKNKKLSPKVYNLDFPLRADNDFTTYSAVTDSVVWECASCSAEMSQDRRVLSESQDVTEQEEDGSQDVYPPTQEEDNSESENSELDYGMDAAKKWARTSSLRRHLDQKRSMHRSTHEAGTVSDGELANGKVSSCSLLAPDHISDTSCHSESVSEIRPVKIGRIANWTAGFDVLLKDPVGLHAFNEFLKKEFSQENIAFWIACENYRQLTEHSQMVKMAYEIYSKHLCIGAHEPVNVDSRARQIAEEGLKSPNSELFLPAQEQIFNLMKFDCYQRFLKSSLFKECLLHEIQGQPLPYQGESLEMREADKGKEKNEEKKKKSFIPWHKLNKVKLNDSKPGRNRLWDRHCEIRKSLKKKKKPKTQSKLDDTSSTYSDVTSSRSSLTSSETGAGIMYQSISSRESLNSAELALFQGHCGCQGHYCRVILPDSSTTVVRTQKGETVGEMLLKLLERRCLTYNAVEAYVVGSHQPLDHSVDVTALSCKEIRVEQVILFCLELPNGRTIGVKAKCGKSCEDILKPVLHKYGYKMDQVIMLVASTKKFVSQNASVTAIDNQRINIYTKETFSDWCSIDQDHLHIGASFTPHSVFPDLETLTNQIFEDLLKTRPEFCLEDLGLVDFEEKRLSESASSSSQKSNDAITRCHEFKRKQKSKAPSKLKAAVCENPNSQNQSKALMPYNATRIISCSESTNCWDPETQHVCKKHNENFISCNSHSLEKENCHLSDNDNVASYTGVDNHLDDNSCTCEKEYTLTSCSDVKNESDNPISQDNHQTEGCFINTTYSPFNFNASNQSEQFLHNLGIACTTTCSKLTPVPLPPGITPAKLSCPIPWSSSHMRTFAKSLPINFTDSVCSVSHNIDMDSTFTGNDSFDVELEADITLKVDDSFARSEMPVTVDIVNAHDNEEVSSLEKSCKDICHSNSDILIMKLSHHRMAKPPPVPPKALARGPPPRPPSRQFVNINSNFCLSSDDEQSDNENLEEYFIKGRKEVKKCYHQIKSDCKSTDISFV